MIWDKAAIDKVWQARQSHHVRAGSRKLVHGLSGLRTGLLAPWSKHKTLRTIATTELDDHE